MSRSALDCQTKCTFLHYKHKKWKILVIIIIHLLHFSLGYPLHASTEQQCEGECPFDQIRNRHSHSKLLCR